MNSWYDILSLRGDESKGSSVDEVQIEKSSQRILKVIDAEAQILNGGADYTKIYLGGFSQGCCMSIYSSLMCK